MEVKQFGKVRYELDDGIAIATLDFPERLNALGSEMRSGLKAVADLVDDDDQVSALIITGAGRAFSAGADIKEMGQEDSSQKSGIGNRNRAKIFLDMFRRIETISKPVIAAVNGYAVGGGTELTLSCDFVVASDQSKFGTPELLTIGMPPGWGAIRLAPIVGIRNAKEILLLRDQFGPEEAMRYGLINRVVPHDKLMETSKELAREVLRRAPLAVGLVKSYINSSLREADITLALQGQGRLAFSEDRKEAVAAFNQKRKPVFKGR